MLVHLSIHLLQPPCSTTVVPRVCPFARQMSGWNETLQKITLSLKVALGPEIPVGICDWPEALFAEGEAIEEF